MRSDAERLLHPIATARAILRREARRDGYDGDALQPCVVADPTEEAIPARIVDTLGKVPIRDQMGYLQVFVGNQVVSPDQRTCGFAREVFTLPLDLEVALCQSFDRFLAVLGPFDLPRDAPMEAFEPLFRLPQITRVGDGLAVRIGVETLQPNVYANGVAGGLMVYLAFCLDGKLDIIAISAFHQAHTLDLVEEKGSNRARLLAGGVRPNQAQRANAGAIGKGDAPPVRFQPPALNLILHRAVIFLEAGIPLLPRFIFAAILIESGDCLPGPVCACMSY